MNLGASLTAEKYAYLGMGCTIMTGVKTLGEDCLIGAGAVRCSGKSSYGRCSGKSLKNKELNKILI